MPSWHEYHRVLIVGAQISGFQTENQRLRVLLLPVPPGGFDQRKGLESRSGLKKNGECTLGQLASRDSLTALLAFWTPDLNQFKERYQVVASLLPCHKCSRVGQHHSTLHAPANFQWRFWVDRDKIESRREL